jgi:hypothetical protein
MTIGTCYMCERPATTREHAPPRCFFPDFKDVGRDLRRNLISVPSCKDHNTAKSHDDQYVMAMVVMQFQTTGVARDQFSSKIIRTLKHSLSLVGRIFAEPRHVKVQDEPSIAVTVDRARFDRVMSSTCRALLYHHSGQKLTDEVTVFSPGIFHKDTFQGDADETALAYEVRRVLKDLPRLGENHDVFWYQFLHQPQQLTAVRLEFYRGFSVYGCSDTRVTRAA